MNRREQRRLRTRKLILDTATELFLARGFLHASTAEIATEAQVAHGTIFLHFPTREHLVNQVIGTELTAMQERLDAIILQNTGFLDLLQAYLTYLMEKEQFFCVISRELPFYPVAVAETIIASRKRVADQLVQAALIAQHHHNLRSLPMRALLDMVLNALYYNLATCGPGQGVINRAAADFNQIYISCLAPPG